jgi:hypothetical protein
MIFVLQHMVHLCFYIIKDIKLIKSVGPQLKFGIRRKDPFYVVRYSCDVTDAKKIPLPYDE